MKPDEMDKESPYKSPESDLISTSSTIEDPIEFRKSLVPKWIKFFGWVFIVFGCVIPFVNVISAITGEDVYLSFYGLEVSGSILSPAAIFLTVLLALHGVFAYGLLFGKAWGVKACIALAYSSILLCVFSMAASEELFIRLEPLIIIPYLLKLHKINADWSKSSELQPN